MATYFNTTNRSGAALAEKQESNSKSDKVILSIFQKVPDATPWEIYGIRNLHRNEAPIRDIVQAVDKLRGYTREQWDTFRGRYPEKIPVTSIRRSISNLTKKGYLRKTDKTINGGPYMDKQHVWESCETSNQFPRTAPIAMSILIIAIEPWMAIAGSFALLCLIMFILIINHDKLDNNDNHTEDN